MNLADFTVQIQTAMDTRPNFNLEFRTRIVDVVPRTDGSNIVDVSTHVDLVTEGKTGQCHEVMATAFQVTWDLIASIHPGRLNELAGMFQARVASDLQTVLIALEHSSDEATPEEHELMNHHVAFAKETLDGNGPDCDW